ncbi:MAG: hypothetical protein QW606_05800, partial [Conexivisphaerales archaeon]
MVVCPSCHSVFDRDVGAANKQEGLCLGNLGETLAEDYASSMLEYIKRIPHVKASIAVEAPNKRAWPRPQGRGSSLTVNGIIYIYNFAKWNILS